MASIVLEHGLVRNEVWASFAFGVRARDDSTLQRAADAGSARAKALLSLVATAVSESSATPLGKVAGAACVALVCGLLTRAPPSDLCAAIASMAPALDSDSASATAPGALPSHSLLHGVMRSLAAVCVCSHRVSNGELRSAAGAVNLAQALADCKLLSLKELLKECAASAAVVPAAVAPAAADAPAAPADSAAPAAYATPGAGDSNLSRGPFDCALRSVGGADADKLRARVEELVNGGNVVEPVLGEARRLLAGERAGLGCFQPLADASGCRVVVVANATDEPANSSFDSRASLLFVPKSGGGGASKVQVAGEIDCASEGVAASTLAAPLVVVLLDHCRCAERQADVLAHAREPWPDEAALVSAVQEAASRLRCSRIPCRLTG